MFMFHLLAVTMCGLLSPGYTSECGAAVRRNIDVKG